MIPQYNNIKFTDVFPNVAAFSQLYTENGLPKKVSYESINTIYYLLYARYGNNPIANNDRNQFIYKLFAIIFQYAPAWEKKLQIQENIRGLSDAEIMQGSKTIYNHALNPSTDPTTATLEELDYINDQNTTNFKRNKLEAYGAWLDLIANDVTEEFILRFKPLFRQFIAPDNVWIYETPENGEEIY